MVDDAQFGTKIPLAKPGHGGHEGGGAGSIGFGISEYWKKYIQGEQGAGQPDDWTQPTWTANKRQMPLFPQNFLVCHWRRKLLKKVHNLSLVGWQEEGGPNLVGTGSSAPRWVRQWWNYPRWPKWVVPPPTILSSCHAVWGPHKQTFLVSFLWKRSRTYKNFKNGNNLRRLKNELCDF